MHRLSGIFDSSLSICLICRVDRTSLILTVFISDWFKFSFMRKNCGSTLIRALSHRFKEMLYFQHVAWCKMVAFLKSRVIVLPLLPLPLFSSTSSITPTTSHDLILAHNIRIRRYHHYNDDYIANRHSNYQPQSRSILLFWPFRMNWISLRGQICGKKESQSYLCMAWIIYLYNWISDTHRHMD